MRYTDFKTIEHNSRIFLIHYNLRLTLLWLIKDFIFAHLLMNKSDTKGNNKNTPFSNLMQNYGNKEALNVATNFHLHIHFKITQGGIEI